MSSWQNYWDEVYTQGFEVAHACQQFSWERFATQLKALYALTPSSVVLDLGCGLGLLGRYLENYVGYDPVIESRQLALKHSPTLTILSDLRDILELPRVDLVISLSALYFQYDPFLRCLRPLISRYHPLFHIEVPESLEEIDEKEHPLVKQMVPFSWYVERFNWENYDASLDLFGQTGLALIAKPHVKGASYSDFPGKPGHNYRALQTLDDIPEPVKYRDIRFGSWFVFYDGLPDALPRKKSRQLPEDEEKLCLRWDNREHDFVRKPPLNV